MTKLTLIRSGGLMGKAMSASKNLTVKEEELIQELTTLHPEKNAMARDTFHYTLVINDQQKFSVDREKLEGSLLKHIDQLEDQLRPL